MLIRQASINPTLTTFAQGVSQDLASALAEFIAPTVRVPSLIGIYKKFDDKNAFQVVDTTRAVGGTARRIEFAASDPTFNCQPQALEVAIDDAERAASVDAMQFLEESKVRTLVQTATASHEDKVVGIMKTLTATGGVGVWSNTSNDPVAEIDAQIEAIAKVCGLLPNAIVFGLGAWRIFRNHPKVLARQPGASLIGVNPDQAATMMLNPAIQVRIGILSKDTAKFGAGATKTNILGNEVFIFLRSPSPSTYDPSWMKTFSGGEGSITSVRQYRDESARSDMFAIDWSEDIQIVSSITASRITLS